jgi:alkyl hydroperoxide reductase subunit D
VEALEALRQELPEAAKDLKLNLAAVLAAEGSSLNEAQRWGVALACGYAAGSEMLRQALAADAARIAGEAVVDDARAAAALMAMNNVYYRFRHSIGKPSYADKPARLRMNRIVRPATNRADFELFCLAVSAINFCEACMKSHEQAVLEGGLTEDQVHDAIRIAATIRGVAVGLQVI